MAEMIWLAPDREVYTVTTVEEPWDEGPSTLTVVFRCDRTGWMGATELDTNMLGTSPGTEDFPLLLRRARAGG
jgi:hypothetical protein